MIKKIFLSIMIMLSLSFLINSLNAYPTDKRKAPEFVLKTLEGKTVKLSDFKGKIVIIDFWATWCPPCRKGIPDLVELQKTYKKDLVIVGISLDQERTLKDLKPFIENFNINYPVVLGNEKVVKDYGGINAIPTAFVVDQDGFIIDSHVGLVPKSVYEEKIKMLLKKM
jgi:cytochrome c biogenesis protein CcmG/thiol:disulfide interchange protein DsbE